jgi:ribose transport system substrate-binding protein
MADHEREGVMQRLVVAIVSVALAMALGLGSGNAADKKVLAFVVNGASDFWKIAEAGVKKAQGELPNFSSNILNKPPLLCSSG